MADNDGKKYTKAQELAINERGKTVLVSAAAGSGKTFVLIERIIKRITDKTDPVGIDELLVVTFTNAAAAEIKQRLSSALSELIADNPGDRGLIRQLALVGSSHIQTNDSFFLSVVKEHFDAAGLPAGFSVCGDENITNELQKKACENVFEKHYAKAAEKERTAEDERFLKVVENFSSARDDNNVAGFLYSVYSQLIKLEDPVGYLSHSIDTYSDIASGKIGFFDSEWGKAAARETCDEIAHNVGLLKKCIYDADRDEICHVYSEALCKLLDYLYKIDLAIKNKNWNEAYETVKGFVKPKLNSAKKCPLGDRIKNDRDTVSSSLKDGSIANMFPCSENALIAACGQCAELLCGIKELYCEFEKEYARLKEERSIVDFSDISRKCYDLLIKDGEPTDIARDTAKKFREIYIDEYQDTNGMQDKIFKTLSELSGAPRFMVGDVKQCIYAFRDSDPSLFMGYYDSFKDAEAADGDSERILLSENFRCDMPVVKTVNMIFRNIMTKTVGSVDYDKNAELVFGKAPEKAADTDAEIMITICGEDAKLDEKADAEAENCAEYIAKLIREEGYAPSDFAVLFRKRARLPKFRKALAERGIPVNDEDGDDVSSLAEIQLILAVLSAIDDPASDIPLAAAMCSPVFGFGYDKLAEYSCGRKGSLFDAVKESAENGDVQAAEFCKKLSDYAKYSLAYGIDKLIHRICAESGIDLAIKALPDGKSHYANVLSLCEAARSFSQNVSGGISEFVSYVTSGKLRAGAASGNGVTLTTVHKSKGLEYRVCILALAHESISSNMSSDFYQIKGLPAAFVLTHSSGFAVVPTPMLTTAKLYDKKEPTSEALRVLYVGMTRARERLVVSAAECAGDIDKMLDGFDCDSDICAPYRIYKAGSQLEWIMRALAKELGTDTLRNTFREGGSLTDFLSVKVVADGAHGEEAPAKAEEISAKNPLAVKVHRDYSYPHTDRKKIRAKLSVSDMKDDDAAETAPQIFTSPASVRPEFTKTGGSHAAEIGTAMHLFMQFCDFEAASKDISAEAGRMEALGFITKRQRELLDEERLSQFFKTKLYSDIRCARKVYRELRYNLPDSADVYVEGAEKSETVLVQGVIDCFFEDRDGGVILVDFKTDRVNTEDGEQVLISRHGFQLSMYKRAIEAMLEKPLSGAYLYSFSLGRAIEVKL